MIGDMPYFDITTGLDGKGNVKATKANGMVRGGKQLVSSAV